MGYQAGVYPERLQGLWWRISYDSYYFLWDIQGIGYYRKILGELHMEPIYMRNMEKEHSANCQSAHTDRNIITVHVEKSKRNFGAWHPLASGRVIGTTNEVIKGNIKVIRQ